MLAFEHKVHFPTCNSPFMLTCVVGPFRVSSAGMKLFGVSDLEYRVKVTTTIAIEDVELGTREKDQADASLARYLFISFHIFICSTAIEIRDL